MGKTYNFAILGCGVISNTHVKAIKSISNAQLLGVADVNYERAKSFADENQIKAYANYEEMLADKSIDIVCICTPSGHHAPNAIQALKSGKHVVVEKPMALNTQSANEITTVANEVGKKVTVISQFRYSEDLIKIRQYVQEGRLGKISLCSLTMKYYRAPEYYSSSSWRGTLKFDGGGALINQGIHGVDMLDYLVGPIVDVDGRIATIFHNIEGEDTAVATFKTESGALGVIQASTCAYPGFDRRIEIHGDKGYAVLRENKLEKLVLDREEVNIDKKEFVSTASDNTVMDYSMHKAQITNFLNSLDGKEKLLMDGEEGKRALTIIENIYKCGRA